MDDMEIKLVHPICCGLDIHKNFVFACIVITKQLGQTPQYIKHRFSTYAGDIRRLAEWLKSYNCYDVCMESSGKYWCPVYFPLEASGLRCTLAHPKYVKSIKGKKTDPKDAKRIGELFSCNLVPSSFIPPQDIRQLRDLCRYYTKLTHANTSEKNRAQNCLTMCNLKVDNVFSDVFGLSATRVLDAYFECRNNGFDIAPLLDRNCKATVDNIRAALDGNIIPEQLEKLKLIREHKAAIDKLKAALESLIIQLASKYKPQVELRLTVPAGVSPEPNYMRTKFVSFASAARTDSPPDMSVFSTAKKLCSWASLTPQNAESAGKKKTTRIGRADAYLKPLLVQCALAVSKSDKHPEIKSKYQTLKYRRGGKKATIAIARRLLTAIFHIISNFEPYNAELYHASDIAPKDKVISQDQAFKLALRMGYSVEGYEPPPKPEVVFDPPVTA